MFNETEWDSNIHAFQRERTSNFARGMREANKQADDLAISPFITVPLGLLIWAGLALLAYAFL